MIGILVLIYKNIPEAVLVFMQHIRKPVEQFIGFKEQVIKIHRTGFKTAVYIILIDLTQPGLFRHSICLH